MQPSLSSGWNIPGLYWPFSCSSAGSGTSSDPASSSSCSSGSTAAGVGIDDSGEVPVLSTSVLVVESVFRFLLARAFVLRALALGLRTAQDGSEDAEQTRELVDAIVEESGEARDREAESTEGGGPSVSLDDIQHALMEDSEEEEEGGSGAGPSSAGGEGGGAGSSTEEPPPMPPAQPPSQNTQAGEGFSAYELERRENILRNELHLESLGLILQGR